uniref:NFX1-type zinc finger-containing protein 1 n=1 Tax=Parascaris univalens TaxID=6257 RepID=A0A915BXJ0_PARUN
MMERDWAVVVYGERHKHLIDCSLTRSFAKVFLEKSTVFAVFHLSDCPSIFFSKNLSILFEEVRELYSEQKPNAPFMLIVFINDSGEDSISKRFCMAFSELMFIMDVSGDQFIACSRDSSYVVIIEWLRKMSAIIDDYENPPHLSQISRKSHSSQSDLRPTKMTETASASAPSQLQSTDLLKGSDLLRNQVDSRLKQSTPSSVRRVNDSKRNVIERSGFAHNSNLDKDEQERVVEDDEGNTALEFRLLLRTLEDVEKLDEDIAGAYLLRYIDSASVQNRLNKPWSSREKNGRLLQLMCEALSTNLPDKQYDVALFTERLFTSGFPQRVFFDGVFPAIESASFWDWDMLYSLHDLLKLLCIARPFNPRRMEDLMRNVEHFLEQLPDRFWKEVPQMARYEIVALMDSLDMHFESASDEETISDLDDEEYRPAWVDCDQTEPPQDFRTLPTRLVQSDIIHPVRPYLRRNKEKGSFSDVEQYLDVQFRLLREDFVSPMRDGIAVWKAHTDDDAFLSRSRDLYEQLDLLIISGVRVEGAQIKRSSGETLRYIKFQPSTSYLDASSQKLKFGQMVALSSDGFKEEALFATIVESSDSRLTDGRIGVSFTSESEPEVSKAKIYTLIESNAYFEMYQHVLEVLKQFGSDIPLPFACYLVDAETKVKLPAYLTRPLATDTKDNDSDEAPKTIPTEISIYGTKYPIKRLMYTLDGKRMGLDEYQRNALVNALKSELAILQGPPGTGKTFIGRVLVRVLFENMQLWNPARTHPLLVVCYTNHALDQFLEGILEDFNDSKFSKEFPTVVRLGGRCKNESLQRCMKAQILEDFDELIDEIAKADKNIVMGQRAKIIKKIGERSALLSERKRDIITYEWLSRVISPLHRKQFSDLRRKAGKTSGRLQMMDETLSEWLTAGTSAEEERSARGTLSSEDGVDYGIVQGLTLQQRTFVKSVEKRSNVAQEQWNAEEDECGFSDRSSLTNECDEESEGASDVEQVMTWKEIEEALMESEMGVNDHYHLGAWDLDEDSRGCNSDKVTIFPPVDSGGKYHVQVQYDRDIVARLNELKGDILKAKPLSSSEAASIKNIDTLHQSRRWMLYAFWVEELNDLANKELSGLFQQYQKHVLKVKETYEKLDEIVLRKALVIGATTTGAAKSRSLLRRLACPIVIIEEAAEVLEAHVLASFTEKCEHAILIGDHQQLRPNPAVHLLAREYKLEISMFERLVKNNYPYSTLVYQHRMAPSISGPLMPFFYPLLEDAENVKTYPNVKGCKYNLFFKTHREPETQIDSMSHCNNFEGDFAVELAAYLCRQGYSGEQITLLCTYAAQSAYVRMSVENRFDFTDTPRVENVDNYQGEENDIVILCLVRSYPSETIGFLAVSNRVCVALSRAKIGFYIVGNIDFLANHSRLWAKIDKSLRENECIGEGFPIVCSIHKNVQEIYDAKEFKKKSPDGGCTLDCSVRLKCGHLCGRRCHADDQEHLKPCTQQCNKFLDCKFQHRCKKRCGEPCGSCTSIVSEVLPCGHAVAVACVLYGKRGCTCRCEKILKCGHQCANKCGEPCTLKCVQIVERKLACGHRLGLKCYEDTTKYKCRVISEKLCSRGHSTIVECSSIEAPCKAPCGRPLPCGHLCRNECHECASAVKCAEHCKAQCGKLLKCGHKCIRRCGEDCEPCPAACLHECQHMCCGEQSTVAEVRKRKCSEACFFCAETCANTCAHRSCPSPCWQPCSVQPCEHACERKLPCRHPCAGLCGEVCPKLCGRCTPERWKELFGTTASSGRILQIESCGCLLLVVKADMAIMRQLHLREPLRCPKCLSKLTVKSCFRYAIQLKKEKLANEKGKFARGLGDCSGYSGLKKTIIERLRIELDQLEGRSYAYQKQAFIRCLVQTLNNMQSQISLSSFNEVAADVWNRLSLDLVDLCTMCRRVAIAKFKSVPKKTPHLHALFKQYFAEHNDVRASLNSHLMVLVNYVSRNGGDMLSVLIPSLACGVRAVFVKYQVGMLITEISKRGCDITKTQMDDIKVAIDTALKTAGEKKQRMNVVSLMKKLTTIYEGFSLAHIVWAELRCLQ